MNIVVLSGHLVTAPSSREQPSGSVVWSFDIATAVDAPNALAGGQLPARVSVPVMWTADSVPPTWQIDTEVVVTGVVRRRFFRSGGATQSRTEVVATDVVDVTKRRPLAKALERALTSLGAQDWATLRSVAG